MAQLKRMDARPDTLSEELCQVNTSVGRIARRQAVIGGFTTSSSPSPSPLALEEEDDDDGFVDDDDDDDDDDEDEDEDEDVSSFGDEEMTASQ